MSKDAFPCGRNRAGAIERHGASSVGRPYTVAGANPESVNEARRQAARWSDPAPRAVNVKQHAEPSGVGDSVILAGTRVAVTRGGITTCTCATRYSPCWSREKHTAISC